jgi:hypothetical protein
VYGFGLPEPTQTLRLRLLSLRVPGRCDLRSFVVTTRHRAAAAEPAPSAATPLARVLAAAADAPLLAAALARAGKLLNGSDFDSSRQRGKPFQFKIGIGQVIQVRSAAALCATAACARPHAARFARPAGTDIRPSLSRSLSLPLLFRQGWDVGMATMKVGEVSHAKRVCAQWRACRARALTDRRAQSLLVLPNLSSFPPARGVHDLV